MSLNWFNTIISGFFSKTNYRRWKEQRNHPKLTRSVQYLLMVLRKLDKKSKTHFFQKSQTLSIFILHLNFYGSNTQRQMDWSSPPPPPTPKVASILFWCLYLLLTKQYSNFLHLVSGALIPHPFLSFINTLTGKLAS